MFAISDQASSQQFFFTLYRSALCLVLPALIWLSVNLSAQDHKLSDGGSVAAPCMEVVVWKSWVVAASELYFAENLYHLLGGYAWFWFDLNYNFYGTGNAAGNAGRKFGLNRTVDGFFVQGTRRFFWRTFIGPRLLFGISTLAPQHFGEQHPELPPFNVGFNMRALGFKVERDTAENRFYPVNGSSTQFSADFF
jgi:hypothetical protein